MTLGPLHLTPRLVEKPWGGRRLADLGRDLPPGALIGESWDVADLDPAATATADPVSPVAAGPHRGELLADLVAQHRAELLGVVAPTSTGRFPLLVKHLDAREHLSVQVHPPAEVLDQQPGAHLKTESWIVVAADPGAELMLGVVAGTTAGDLQAAFGTAALVPLLRRVPAQVGDVHHVPAGLLHALGAGVVVAEVQTPSDTTYRLYDWTEEYRRAPRELHEDLAMQCLRARWETNLAVPEAPTGDGLLVDTPHYRISRYSSTTDDGFHIDPRDRPRVVVVTSGGLVAGSAQERAGTAPLGPGGVVLLPAAWSGAVEVAGASQWLDIDLV